MEATVIGALRSSLIVMWIQSIRLQGDLYDGCDNQALTGSARLPGSPSTQGTCTPVKDFDSER